MGLQQLRRNIFWQMLFLIGLGLVGCTVPPPPATPTAEASEPTLTLTPAFTATPLPSPTLTLTPTPAANDLSLPLRVALYYPWQAEDWEKINPLPARGEYDSREPAIIEDQIEEMNRAGIQAAALFWREEGATDFLSAVLQASREKDFYWGVLLDIEKQSDPSAALIQQILDELAQSFGTHPNIWRLERRFALIVDVDEVDDGCGMVSRWLEANRGQQFFLIMQVFENYNRCSSQPDMWVDLYPQTPIDPPPSDTQTLQVNSWDGSELAALERSMMDWGAQVQTAGAPRGLQIIRAYNDWGGGMNLEAAAVWGESADYYLEVLRRNGQGYAALVEEVLFKNEVVLVGAGDIAICGEEGSQYTADLLDQIPGTVFTAGDNSNEEGSAANYQSCFNPTWGRHKDRIYPAAGNHDLLTAQGAPYYAYFGERAGEAGKGYYSFDLGQWHVIVLNSVCEYAGGCGEDSPQMEWLRKDLAEHENLCTLAIWHYPLFTSGTRGGNEVVRPFWKALYEANADVIVNGHDHHYERFAPLNPDGQPDAERGIRQFIVGTGGAGLRGIGDVAAHSEKRILYTYGVLKLVLKGNGYYWEFVPVAGMGATDSGSGVCH
ncbi:MAG: metallophosphoesterase [Chloroflexota bacterium]